MGIQIQNPSEFQIPEYRTLLVFGIQMVKSVTQATIQISDILDHKPDFSVRFSNHNLNTGPFYNLTKIYHLNTGLDQNSDGYCTRLAQFVHLTNSLDFERCRKLAFILVWHSNGVVTKPDWNLDFFFIENVFLNGIQNV